MAFEGAVNEALDGIRHRQRYWCLISLPRGELFLGCPGPELGLFAGGKCVRFGTAMSLPADQGLPAFAAFADRGHR